MFLHLKQEKTFFSIEVFIFGKYGFNTASYPSVPLSKRLIILPHFLHETNKAIASKGFTTFIDNYLQICEN